MGGAFLRAMDMKISQSEAFFDSPSIRQVKMRLYRVKMMSHKEKTDIFFMFLFCAGGNRPFGIENSDSGQKMDIKDDT